MSPEQARGVAVDARSDLFSCGVVLHEMLAGQRPFVGNTPVDVISAILRDEPLPISTLHPDAPLELSQIVARCLEKLPEKRYQTASELADDIARCLRQLKIHKKEYSPALHIPNTLVGR
jgi:serine/threonine-protein kinase